MQDDDVSQDLPTDHAARASDSYARLRDLFAVVAELEEDARCAWLDVNVCDAEERTALESLLAADRFESGYFETPADEHAARMAADEPLRTEGLVGQRIGAFRLVRLLGKGGMAAVFLGAREGADFEQRVAVKLLRRGLYSDIEQRLFRRERQLLAGLDHPNIARLIDGGVTTAGIPYLVIEYVDGEPITRHAGERGMGVRGRLGLFLIVCRAVEAAHRALIVHRDIKPSNILVADDGAVKLLDFGIAKLLEEDADSATIGVFTPDYAAPEQLSGAPITTATDVYALGVLLHELLLGMRPRRDSTRRPSSLAGASDTDHVKAVRPVVQARELRGDLDTILLKCLASEPARRYASAGALADDIERHLAGNPVEAHPPSRWYRARKFVQRHRGSVAITATLAVAIIGSLGFALWQADVARQQANRANTVRDFLVSVFQSAGADLPKDKRPTAEDLVTEATQRLMARSDLPDALRSDLLLTLAKVARSAGAYDRAIELVDRNAPIADRLYSTGDAQWWDARVTRALALSSKERYADTIALLDPLRSELLARRDEIGINGLVALGEAMLHTGNVDAGLALIRQAREVADVEAPHLPDALLLSVSIKEESALTDAQHFREALERADATLALWRRLGAPPSQSIVVLYGAIALDAEATGDIARAESAYKDAIALGDQFFDKPSPATAWNVGMYGSFLIAQGRFAEAEPYARRGLEMRKAVFGDEDARTLNAVAAMGKLYAGQNKFPEAEQWYTQGIDACRKDGLNDVVCPRLLSNRGRAFSGEARFVDAERDIREAMALQQKVGGDANAAYAYILDNLVVVQLRQKQYDAAIGSADRSLSIYRSIKGGMIQSELTTRFQRASALFELGRNDEVLQEILDVEPRYASLFPNGGSRFNMIALKARALATAGRAEDAEKAAQDALSLPRKPASIDPKTIDQLQRLANSR
jgi:serine/threonine protein kinase/Tfp pilus assembly protein PilF